MPAERYSIRVQLHHEGDLIAAVPYMLGFWPEESVVIAAHAGATGRSVALCLRADIPPEDLYYSLAAQLKVPVVDSGASGATILLVCGDPGGQELPYRALVDHLTMTLDAADVTVHDALWASEITEGGRWSSYVNLERSGLIPDPKASALASASTVLGTVTYESKEDMRASLELGDSQPLARRSERIAAVLCDRPSEAASMKLVDDAITHAFNGTLDLDEDRIVDLAVALTHIMVRDHCLVPDSTRLNARTEQLWADLTRALPAPYRAEPAFLLAVTAFLRGDGAMAGVALAVAEEADPGHVGAHLLRHAMDMGMLPETVAKALADAFPGVHDRGGVPDVRM